MLTINVDEAFAFDLLSVVLTKTFLVGKKQPEAPFLVRAIRNQIGKKLYEQIMNSPEIEDLIKINSRIFQLVDKVRAGDKRVSARMIDDANMERFAAKKTLQKKFFGNELREKKYNHKLA